VEAQLHSTRFQPRYDALYDRQVLTNWICLIADDRGLDATAISRLADIDVETASSILTGVTSPMSAAALDEVLRRLERVSH